MLLVHSFMFTGPGRRRCAYRRKRPLGGGRREHYLLVRWEFTRFFINELGESGIVVLSFMV